MKPVALSSVSGIGISELQSFIREQLFGAAVTVRIPAPTSHNAEASERVAADVYARGMVEDDVRSENGEILMQVWVAEASQAQLKARWGERIDIK